MSTPQTDPRETDRSIKARQGEIFVAQSAAPETGLPPYKTFRDYLRETTAAPLSMGLKASLCGAGMVVTVLLSAALIAATKSPHLQDPPSPNVIASVSPGGTTPPAAKPQGSPSPAGTKKDTPPPAPPKVAAAPAPSKTEPKTAVALAPQPAPSRPAVAGLARLQVVLEKGIAVARIVDRALVQEADIAVLANDLGALAAAGYDRIVLDFGDLESISNQFVVVIVKFQRQCQAAGGVIKLCGIRPGVVDVFRMMNAAILFEAYPDEAAAMQSPWSPPAASRAASDVAGTAPRRPDAEAPASPNPAPSPSQVATQTTATPQPAPNPEPVRKSRSRSRIPDRLKGLIDQPKKLFGEGEEAP
jgi:anti-anti-sigma regulatory factor